jgi:serine/threonine-protein kinase RsbW
MKFRNQWKTQISSTIEEVETLCAKFRIWHGNACPEFNPFLAELLLREAVTNAVVHGSLEDPSQKVWCVFRVWPNRMLISVRDQGEGFDWRAARKRLADVSEPTGRGIQIYEQYATTTRFNEKGNCITVVKKF